MPVGPMSSYSIILLINVYMTQHVTYLHCLCGVRVKSLLDVHERRLFSYSSTPIHTNSRIMFLITILHNNIVIVIIIIGCCSTLFVLYLKGHPAIKGGERHGKGLNG